MKIVLASNNESKIKEVKSILRDNEIISMNKIGYTEDIPEPCKTFQGNALMKAEALATFAPEYTILADDSGVIVPCLGNLFPGVESKRFLDGTDSDRNKYLIERAAGQKIIMETHFALWMPSGEVYINKGTIEGTIFSEERGENGFAYDKIIYLPRFRKTIAELSDEMKNIISQRAQALFAIREHMKF